MQVLLYAYREWGVAFVERFVGCLLVRSDTRIAEALFIRSCWY